jgi:hypothetical protein
MFDLKYDEIKTAVRPPRKGEFDLMNSYGIKSIEKS